MVRLASYLVSCALLGAALWWLASAKVTWLLPSLWVVGWIVGLIVTWTVARREGRHPAAWVAAALVIGPLAWVLLAVPRPTPVRWGPDDPADDA